ncbi:MAG: primosomal protein N' [Beijerinckiaceae bacterium]|nr:primosomal protein N' [Beijerinckiaceae bacterium]
MARNGSTIDTLFEAPATMVAEVLIPLALDQTYSYRLPKGLEVAPGDSVAVPLGPRDVVGVVWETTTSASGGNLKAVIGRIDAPPLSQALRDFVDWVARYTLAPRGMVLKMALRLPDEERSERITIGVRLTDKRPERMTPARIKVIAAAEGGLLHTKRELAELAGVSVAVIDGLIDEEVLLTEAIAAKPVALPPDPDHHQPILSAEQKAVADVLVAQVRAHEFKTSLLEGVTGSGKTEVYFEAIAEAIRQGRQALVMVPEIALTAQFLDRFTKRFGVRPVEWHSGITGRKRERTLAAIASGDAKVVAGARSALFLPYANLGLIVLDEEHEAAYKQEDGVHYHARDMAVVRGRFESCPVILASATPSLESRVNAEQGRYAHLRLPERFGGRALPDLAAIDMRVDAPVRGKFLSPKLVTEMRATIERGEQVLLYLNRRGYAPLTLCRDCGHRFQCPDCTAWLVEHRFRRALMCHHCGHLERKPDACPACGAEDSLTACGPGVERIAEEVAEIFPDARRIVLSSDMPGGTERLRRELDAVAQGEFQIIIGTQLVAKGHHFPSLALVGVIDADLGLSSADPRAAERTFQLLQQVTGRAGRAETAGRGLMQTFQPDHPVMKAILSGDSERFYAEEIALRRAAGLPPFGRLAALVVSGTDRAEAEAYGRALARAAEAPPDIQVLGPAEAPIAMIRGRHRFRLLVKTPRAFDMQAYIRAWIARAPKPRGSVKVGIDIDPQSFL